MTASTQNLKLSLTGQLENVVFGLEDTIHLLLIAVIARGHVLLQGSPGLGKTLLSRSLAATIGGTFRRIQGTADLLPTDITGVNVMDMQNATFRFEPGPLFADVVLFDEINRAGPRTQSALLEAMEERRVSVDTKTYKLSDEFLVIGTQNPFEYEGTYPLPESQLDRFLLRIELQNPEKAAEQRVLERYLGLAERPNPVAGLTAIDRSLLDAARREVDEVQMSDDLQNYILDIARATRESERLSLGLSTRGTLALARAARVEAALRGGEYVIPDDVKRVAGPVINHRLVLRPDALIERVNVQSHLADLIDAVAVPR